MVFKFFRIQKIFAPSAELSKIRSRNECISVSILHNIFCEGYI